MMNGSKIALGSAIKLARKRNRMTIEMLGNRLGKSSAYISRIENGTTNIELETLEKLSNILNTPLIQLLTDSSYLQDEKSAYYQSLEKDFTTFIETTNKNMYYNIDIPRISSQDMDLSLWTIDSLLHVLNKKYQRQGE